MATTSMSRASAAPLPGRLSRSSTDRTKFLPILPKPLIPMRTPTSITLLVVAWNQRQPAPKGQRHSFSSAATTANIIWKQKRKLRRESLRIVFEESRGAQVGGDEPDAAFELADR